MNSILVLLTILSQFVYIAVCRFHAGISLNTLVMNARDTKNPNCICLHNVVFRIRHSAWVTLGGIFENFAVCVCASVCLFLCFCVGCAKLFVCLAQSYCETCVLNFSFRSHFFLFLFFPFLSRQLQCCST